MSSLVLIAILLPLAAALLMLLVDPQAPAGRARMAALIATVATFFVAWGMAAQLIDAVDVSVAVRDIVHPRLEFRHTWMQLGQTAMGEPLRFEFFLGVDGISAAFVLLTTIISVCAVLASWKSVERRATEFYAALLLLEAGVIGVFCSFDILLFYVFYEFTLLPLYFLIGLWGGPQRSYAATKFFLYSLAGSFVTLLGIVSLVVAVQQQTGLATPFSIPDLAAAMNEHPLPSELQATLFLLIVAGFMVKAPVFPFHTWLPVAYVESPTAGLLGGMLLKLGAYGILRICLPLLPDACRNVGMPILAVLAVVGIIYGSLCALAQTDIKRLVAYSSIAHLGFGLLGLFALNAEGVTGGIWQLMNQALSTGAMFCLVAMIYERYQTRSLTELGGIATQLPRLASFTVLIAFASIGLPGLNGFIGEVLSLAGMFKVHVVYAALGALGVVLSAWYLLGMLQRLLFGTLQRPLGANAAAPADLDAREVLLLSPLAVLCLYLGLFPQTLIDLIRPDVHGLLQAYSVSAPADAVALDRSSVAH